MTSEEGIFEPMVPAPREPPAAAQISHAELGQAWRCEVYRDPAGRPLLSLVEFEGGQALPLLFGRQAGWRLLSAPAATAEPNRLRQSDQLERQVLAWEILDWENDRWVDVGAEEAPVGNTLTRL